VADEVLVDAYLSGSRHTRATQQGTEGRAGHWCGHNQPRKETHGGAGEDTGDAWKCLAFQSERSVGVAHYHRAIQQDEVLASLAGAPPQSGDLVADLIRPL